MRTDDSDERFELVVRLRESVASGTYRVAAEDVAAAIMAGPFVIRSDESVGDGFATGTETSQHNDHG